MQDFIKHLHQLNYFISSDKVSLDGKIIRFDRDGKLNAWLVGFQNHTRKGDPYIVATFGDWKTGEQETFTSARSFTANEKKLISEDIKKQKIKIQDERIVRQDIAAKESQEFWLTCSENPASEYIKIKQIKKLYGAKTSMESSGRTLVIPIVDIDGKMWGVQKIYQDRSKRFWLGSKKSGNFHVIPYSDALQDQPTIYIAEGFATAASIHEATGFAVVVAFDSGNLIHVAKALKGKYGDKPVIICGDVDESGVGQKCAEDAAKAVLGKVILPKFEKLKGSDFNDLAVSEGLERVREQVMGIKPELHTVSCLGYSDDVYYFISSEKPNVVAISSGGFTKNRLLDLMPYNYWETKFPMKKTFGIDVDKAVDSLMTGCRKAGKFQPKHVRGAGVWQDQKRTVVNLGDSLWVDGQLQEYRQFKSRYIYQAADRISAPREDLATVSEMNKLDTLLHKLSWKNPAHPKLLLGWLMIAPVCGSLAWRPHVWITGPSGSGKTTVMQEIIGKLFGNDATKIMGRSTEAGIRQSVASDARPLLFDENETTDKKSEGRVASVIELFRQASSETDSHVVKGTVNGKAIAFNVRFCAVVSSIRVGLSLEQDVNRFTVLDMFVNKNNGFTDIGGTRDQLIELITPEFAERMYARSVRKLPVILSNYRTFFKIYQKRTSSRFADQYGTLLAGYMAALSDSAVTELEANEIVNVVDLKEHETAASVRDESECLDYLLSKRIVEGGHSYTIGELVNKIMDPSLFDESENSMVKIKIYGELLARYGLRVVPDGLAVSVKNPELTMIFRDSKWPIGWGQALARLEGASQRAVRFGSASAWATVVEIKKIV